jgi:hypothetical protein
VVKESTGLFNNGARTVALHVLLPFTGMMGMNIGSKL